MEKCVLLSFLFKLLFFWGLKWNIKQDLLNLKNSLILTYLLLLPYSRVEVFGFCMLMGCVMPLGLFVALNELLFTCRV